MTTRLARTGTLTAIAVAVVVAIGVGLIGDGVPDADATITLTEHVVGMPNEIVAGEDDKVVFEVTNVGHAHHNLTVCELDESNGKCASPGYWHRMLKRPEDARDPSFYKDEADFLVIGKRWTTWVEYELPPGRYRFFCGIVGHAEQGMSIEVTVS